MRMLISRPSFKNAFLNERILKHFIEFRVKSKRKFNDKEAEMCSTGGWIIKRCSLERNLFITRAAIERARRAPSFTCTLMVQYTMYKPDLLRHKESIYHRYYCNILFCYQFIAKPATCYSGALRPRDYRRRALVCLGSYANEPTSCSEEGLNYLDEKYDRVPNDPVDLSDI